MVICCLPRSCGFTSVCFDCSIRLHFYFCTKTNVKHIFQILLHFFSGPAQRNLPKLWILLLLALAGPAGDLKNAMLRSRLGCCAADCA